VLFSDYFLNEYETSHKMSSLLNETFQNTMRKQIMENNDDEFFGKAQLEEELEEEDEDIIKNQDILSSK